MPFLSGQPAYQTCRVNPSLPDRETVRSVANARIADIAHHVWSDDTVIRQTGQTLRFGAKGARAVHLEGPLAGRYADWEAGHTGDVFDLWARSVLHLSGAAADFPAVLRDLAAFLGVSSAEPVPTGQDRPVLANKVYGPFSRHAAFAAKCRADARAIAIMCAAARPLPGSIAMGYLAARGLGLIGSVPDLLFLPGGVLQRRTLVAIYEEARTTPPPWIELPAILCLARNAAGELTGLQRILLGKDGRRPAPGVVPKPSTGRLKGAALHLPARDRGPVLLAEGPETALSLWVATGYETRASLGSFRSGLPLGPSRTVLLVCHDADPPGSTAETARLVFLKTLIDVGYDARSLAPPLAPTQSERPGRDFNDVLMDPRLGTEAIRRSVRAALGQDYDPETRINPLI